MSKDDKLFELPKMTYNEREDILICLLLCSARTTDNSEGMRLDSLYHKIQEHF